MYQQTQGVSIDPIISRLRPRTVGEILDQAFRLYRRYFLIFISIIAVVVVPLQLAVQTALAFLVGGMAGFQNSFSGPSSFGTGTSTARFNELFAYVGVVYAVVFALGIAQALLQSLSQGALTGEVANSHLDKPVSFGDGYRQMFSRLGPLLGAIFLQLVVTAVIFLPIILLFVLSAGAGLSSLSNSFSVSPSGSSGSTAFVGLFCLSCVLIIPAAILFAYVFMRLYVVTPVIMVERLGPAQAFRRSWDLVRNYWWRTFAIFLVLGVLAWVVQAVPSLIVQTIVRLFAPSDLVLQQLISGVVTVFSTVLFIPIQMTAITLYYFDLRVRKEGYDLETALAQRYSTAPPLPSAWSGATYGQGAPTGPMMPPPALGASGQYEAGTTAEGVKRET